LEDVIPEFAIITIICQPHLGPDEEDLRIVNDYTAVIDDILVYNRPAKRKSRRRIAKMESDFLHANVADNITDISTLENLCENLPRVQMSITFQKMV
jgi:hypothetical protein